MRIGILGGTGPAGRGLAVRLAAAGDEVVIGSRDAGAGRRRWPPSLVERWPDRDLAIAVRPTRHGRRCRRGRGGHAVGQRRVATVEPLAAALAGKVVVSMANALVKEGREFLALMPPRGSVAASVQAALPDSLVSAVVPPPARLGDGEARPRRSTPTCWCARTTPRPPRPRWPWSTGSTGSAASTPAACRRPRAIEAFTAVLITVNIRHKVHAAVRLAGFRRR